MKNSDLRIYAIRLLSMLNFYYSLRSLEKMLRIHHQTLWKYINMQSIPKEDTALKLLTIISENKVVHRIVLEELKEGEGEEWRLARKPGFIALFTLLALPHLERLRVNTLVPLSLHACFLASPLAVELDALICPVLEHELKREKQGVLTISYCENDIVKLAAIPRSCIRPSSRIALIEVIVSEENIEKVERVADAVRKAKATPVIVLTVTSKLRGASRLKGIEIVSVSNLLEEWSSDILHVYRENKGNQLGEGRIEAGETSREKHARAEN